MAEPPRATDPAALRARLVPVALLGLVVLFLSPYVLQGRSLVPFDMLPLFQPWARHARELWEQVPAVHNPLLDSIQQYYPRRVHVARSLHAGYLPLWDPYVYGGSPFLGMQQGAVLYPPAWLLALLAPEVQFGWSALLHLGLAVVAAYAFFRELALRPAGAAAGAVAFAFNGYVVVWLAYPNVTQWTLCWLPVALYLWERGRRTDDLRWGAAAGLALALNVLGGHGQSSEYVLLTWGAWALFRCLADRVGVAGLVRWLVLPGALAVALAFGHLLPVLDYVPRTDRGGRVPWPQVVEAGMPVTQLWTFVLPRLFGDGTSTFLHSFWMPTAGKAGLAFVERSFYPGASVLALCGAAWGARRERQCAQLAAFGIALAVLAVLLAMATPLYWPFWRLVPGFGNFTAVARVVCVAGWGLAAAAAVGVHALTGPDAAARRDALRGALVSGAAVLLAACIGHYIHGGNGPEDLGRALAASGRTTVDALANLDFGMALLWILGPVVVAALLQARRAGSESRLRPELAGVLLVAIVAADLFSFGFNFNPAADPALMRAETPEIQALRQRPGPFRMLSIGPVTHETEFRYRMPSNLPSLYGWPDIQGSDSFVPLRFRRWEAALGQASGGPSPWSRPGAGPLRSAGVRYYLTRGDDAFPGMTALAGSALQEDPSALPFARLHTRTQVLDSPEAVLAALGTRDRFLNVALVSAPGAPAYDGPPAIVPFTVTRRGPNRLLLEGSSDQPGLLVVCEGFDPGWTARVDGAPAPVFPADHLLLGVPVAAGSHRVELVYAPHTFRVGLFITLAALAVLGALLLLPPRRAPAGTGPPPDEQHGGRGHRH